MKVSLFDYELPRELIAQHPATERAGSRMLVLHRTSGETEHRQFHDLPGYLRRGDCLVINDTRVIPARLIGRRAGGGRVELLLLRPLEDSRWEALARPARRLRRGDTLEFGPRLSATVLEELAEGVRVVELKCAGDLMEVLAEVGLTPLPPYIRRDQHAPNESSPPQAEQEATDRQRYQTVYAQNPGAVAAPTAGLHFDEGMLNRLKDGGIGIARITLHTGAGTFRPVKAQRVEDHVMEAEYFQVSSAAAQTINECRAAGDRIIAVGTTVVRTVETAADEQGRLAAASDWSHLFIFPGYQFKVVDALLTNFHLPRSTLLMLVCAFAGREQVLRAYLEAVQQRYRFYSYGDCTFIQ